MTSDFTLKPLLRTKLQRPPIVGDHIHRTHLLDRLNQRRLRPLTLVAAPAGYGKSTLVSCWLEACNIPSAWFSLDESDNELHLFLSYLVAAVQTVSASAGKQMELILNGPELPHTSILTGIFINELDQIKQNFILTLDDYHVISNNDIHELVVEMLKHPPRAMHLVLASRIDPPLPLASLRAKGEMTEIRVQDLRFSLDETTDFLQKMMGKKLDERFVATMGEKTEGWVTGLRLAALSMRHREDLDRVLIDLPDDHHYVMDYMATEVLSQLAPTVQQCLLKTSILDRFSAHLCQEICAEIKETGTNEITGKDFLDQIKKANLFLISLDPDHRWFRYHHLFQEILKRLLKRRFSPDEIETLHRKMGAWFADRGLIEEALNHFLSGGDARSAVRLVLRHRHDVMNQEHWHRLERWLNLLPSDSLEKYPELRIAAAWLCEIRVRLSEVEAHLMKFKAFTADAHSKTTDEWEALIAEFNVQKSFILFLEGDGQGTITATKSALGKIAPQALNVQGICQTMMAAGYQMTGQLKNAYDVLYDALKKKVPLGTAYHSWLYSGLCFIHWMAADLTGLDQGARQLLRFGQDFNLPRSIAFGHYFLGIFHYLRNELAEAEAQLVLAVQDLYKADTVNYSHSTFALALCLQVQHQFKDAAKIVDKLIGHALKSLNTELLNICHAFQAELALRQGNLPKAEQWARNYDPHPFHPGYRFYLPPLTLAKVHLALNTEQSQQQADDLLSQLHNYYSSIHNTRFIIDIMALQALARDARSDETAAFEKLVDALRLAEPDNIIRPFLDLGSDMADLLTRLAQKDVSIKFIGILLKAFRNEMAVTAQSDLSVPAPIEQPFPNTAQLDSLSKRELEIMTLLGQRLTNQEIAEKLFLSTKTVKAHLYNIYQKLNTKNRRQAVEKARTLGIV